MKSKVEDHLKLNPINYNGGKIMNPEAMITSVYRHTIKLLNATSVLGIADTLSPENELKKIIRKLVISEAMYNKNIIAVSGLQGVGKSTIIKNFYELDDNILPIVAGRGERLPILITEYSGKSTSAYAVRLVKQDDVWSRIEEDITWEEFNSLAKGEDYNAMFLGMKIPFKHFNNSYTSLLILPGYESTGEDYWETLIDYSLTCANTVLFAMSENKLADGKNKEIMERVMGKFSSTKPIFALTFADLSEDQNIELKGTFMNTYDIDANEEDRVVRIGAYNKEKNQEWINNLSSSIQKYCLISKAYRRQQLDVLEDLIRKQLPNSISKIEEILRNNSINFTLGDKRIQEVLKVYDEEKTRLLDRYKKNIKKSFNVLEREAKCKITEKVQEDKNYIIKIKKALLPNSIKDEKRMEELLEDILEVKVDGYITSVFQQKNVEAIHSVFNNRMTIYCEDSNSDDIISISYNDSEIGMECTTIVESDSNSSINYMISAKSIDEVRKIFRVGTKVNKFEFTDLARTVKLLPVMATENMALTYGVCRVSDKKEIVIEDKSEQFKKWDVMSKMPNKVATGFAAVAGLDLVDGTPNIALAIARTIGMELSLAAAVGITGALALTTLGVHLGKQVNENQRNERNELVHAVKILRGLTEDDCIEKYKDYLEVIRERFLLRLKEIYGVKELDSRVDNLIIALKDLRCDIEDMGVDITDARIILV